MSQTYATVEHGKLVHVLSSLRFLSETGATLKNLNRLSRNPWVGIGFGIERLTMALNKSKTIKRYGGSIAFIDGQTDSLKLPIIPSPWVIGTTATFMFFCAAAKSDKRNF